MILFALAVASATLAAGLAAGFALRRVPTLRLQLAGLALLAVVLPLAAVVLALAIGLVGIFLWFVVIGLLDGLRRLLFPPRPAPDDTLPLYESEAA